MATNKGNPHSISHRVLEAVSNYPTRAYLNSSWLLPKSWIVHPVSQLHYPSMLYASRSGNCLINWRPLPPDLVLFGYFAVLRSAARVCLTRLVLCSLSSPVMKIACPCRQMTLIHPTWS